MRGISNDARLAQSASSLGAAILGFGIGARWGSAILNYSVWIIMVGGLIHVAGMYVLQLTDGSRKKGIAKMLWISAWICLLVVIAMFVALA